MKDEDLIVLYLEGEEEKLSELISKYLTPIYRFVFGFVHDEVVANDITQDIFVKVWKNLKKYNPKYSFKTWLYTIAKNTVFDYLKSKKSINFSDLNSEEITFEDTLEDDTMSALEIFENSENSELVKKAIGALPPKYQPIIHLYYFNELTFAEIAEIVGEPLNTVKSKHRRAVQKLKEIIDSSNLNI